MTKKRAWEAAEVSASQKAMIDQLRKAERMIMIETKQYATVGDRIFEVTWETLRPAAADKEGDDIDVDRDLESHVRRFATKEAAIKAAHKIASEIALYWGVVDVRELVAEVSPNDSRIGSWEPVGESIEITD